MCHQSVGLIQGAIEALGIATVSVSTCEEITVRVRPPRVLCTDFPFGYPLGRPHDARGQRRVLEAALALFASPGPPPVAGRHEAGERGEAVHA